MDQCIKVKIEAELDRLSVSGQALRLVRAEIAKHLVSLQEQSSISLDLKLSKFIIARR